MDVLMLMLLGRCIILSTQQCLYGLEINDPPEARLICLDQTHLYILQVYQSNIAHFSHLRCIVGVFLSWPSQECFENLVK